MKLRDLAVSRRDEFCIPLEKVVDFENVRSTIDKDHVKTLSESIAVLGQLEAVTIRQCEIGVIITNGQHRYLAIKRANEVLGADIKSIRCVSEPPSTNEETRLIRSLASNSGLPMEPLDEARVYERLIGFNWTPKDIAEKSGKRVKHITDLLELLGSSKELRTKVEKKEISVTTAKKVAKKPEAQQAAVVAQEGKVTAAKAAKTLGEAPAVVSVKQVKGLIEEARKRAKEEPQSEYFFNGAVCALRAILGNKDCILTLTKKANLS